MNTENQCRDFDGLLPNGPDALDQIETSLELMDEHRKGPRDIGKALDRYLMESYASQLTLNLSLKHDLESLRKTQAELRDLIEKLMEPPWAHAVFLGSTETSMGMRAKVEHGGGRFLVTLGKGVNLDDLTLGQVVYLGRERNSILYSAPPEQRGGGEIATVEQVLDDGRLLLQDRDQQVVVDSTPAVEESRVGPGDGVRWRRDLMLALEPVKSRESGKQFITEYIQAVPVQQLGGLGSKVDRAISLFTLGVTHPELAKSYGLNRSNTLLMYGPPGNGKTTIARLAGSALAAATKQQCRFASVKGAELESPWVGTTQQNIRDLFRELRRDPRPTVLLIDELDAISPIRGEIGGHHSDKFLSTWLTETDGIERLQDSLGIIATTNRKDLIDPALLERFSGLELHISRPGLEAAREIFEIHMPSTLPYGPNGAEAECTRQDIIETAVGRLYSPNGDNAIAEVRFRDGSARTIAARQLLSGRTIEQICAQARRSAFRRHARGGTSGVRVEDMEEAVANALARLATTLSPANARAMIDDLPRDPDVVAVEPIRRKETAHLRYP